MLDAPRAAYRVIADKRVIALLHDRRNVPLWQRGAKAQASREGLVSIQRVFRPDIDGHDVLLESLAVVTETAISVEVTAGHLRAIRYRNPARSRVPHEPPGSVELRLVVER